MRKLILLLTLLIGGYNISFGQLISKVDERIELTGVVFRLAGIPEYTEGVIEEYNEDIDNYFADFRYGDLTAFVIKLRNENGLGYSSVAGSALALSIENGHVIQHPCFLNSELPGLGPQWKDEETFKKYVELLDDFYVKSNFRKFFEDHKELYQKMEANINELFADFNGKWFSDFFGIPLEYPIVFVGVGNGHCNYYIVDYESDTDWAIVIGGRMQHSAEYTIPTIIHEICHNYSNPLFYKYWPQMEQAANKIYDKDTQEKMAESAYGDASATVREWQNNLCVAMYLQDNAPLYKDFWVANVRDMGFIWMPRSVQFMENYYGNRDKYPHFDSFMTQIVEFLNYTANDFERVKFEYENRHPYVVSVFPVNGSNIKDGNFSEIKVKFSKPMVSGCYSVGVVKDDASFSRIPRSEIINPFWEDEYTFIIPIEPSQVENNKKYGVVLESRGFLTNDLSNLHEDYLITFNTLENENI